MLRFFLVTSRGLTPLKRLLDNAQAMQVVTALLSLVVLDLAMHRN